jgi:hypothetical protein
LSNLPEKCIYAFAILVICFFVAIKYSDTHKSIGMSITLYSFSKVWFREFSTSEHSLYPQNSVSLLTFIATSSSLSWTIQQRRKMKVSNILLFETIFSYAVSFPLNAVSFNSEIEIFTWCIRMNCEMWLNIWFSAVEAHKTVHSWINEQ